MHGPAERKRALELLADGADLSSASRATGIARSTIRTWSRDPGPLVTQCFRCATAYPGRGGDYVALLGFYLGDGYIARHRSHTTLRISCDPSWPAVIDDIRRLIVSVHPEGCAGLVRAPGTIIVQNTWKHWPCLFPQHGSGRKHERSIVLAAWQEDVVRAFPADFLRGLFHSDGARVNNWATRVVAGEKRRYDYPRWQFSNRSEDILGLCCWALDLAGVAWRRSGPWTVSVSRRDAVVALDALIGPKS